MPIEYGPDRADLNEIARVSTLFTATFAPCQDFPSPLVSSALHTAVPVGEGAQLRRRYLVLALGFALALTAALPAAATGGDGPRTQTYEVTFTNVSATQWFTPPVVATHGRHADVFEAGHAASAEIQQLSENGNIDPLVAALSGSRAVHDVQVGVFSDDLPPLAPGASVTVEITGTSKTRLLSSASMLICTNDGFTGLDSVKLPRRIAHPETTYAYAWDAGTEINTEDFADIVPPCQALNGVSSDDDGTGATNPALAEGGVIARHGGIVGGDDLTPDAHGFDAGAPVLSVTVTRTG